MASVAGEVKLYLAVASPSSSRVSLPVRSSARHRSSSGPVLGPPPPRLEVSVRVQELLEDLHDQGPQLDRLGSGLAVVLRVGRQRDVELAGDTPLEPRRRVGLDRLELHGRPVSSYGPGNTRSWVTITLKA